MNAERLDLLGLPLDPVTMDGAVAWVRERLGEGGQVVTLNPEIIVQAHTNLALARAIREAELVTPDGVGVLWAVRRLYGRELPERVTGVDLTVRLFEQLGGELRVFFLGGRSGVAERAAATARERYGVGVAGCAHGYFGEEEEAALVKRVRASGANLLLAGLGPRQEVFLHRHKGRLGGAVGIGVGGTLDVLAGEARRAPAWARRLGVEWLLRVGLDPKRWPRAVRLVRFAWWIEREARRLPRQKT